MQTDNLLLNLSIKIGKAALVFGFVAAMGSTTLVFAAENEEEDSGLEKEVAGEDLDQLVKEEKGTDIVCQADVYYTWHKTPSPMDQNSPDKTPPVKPKVVRTFYKTVGEHGLSLTDLKNRLTSKLATVQSDALSHCKRMHQDQAGCLATRLRKLSTDYKMMDFSSRKTMLAAIKRDCDGIAGTCISAEANPAQCFLNRPPDAPAPDKTDPEAEKKGKKKKKK